MVDSTHPRTNQHQGIEEYGAGTPTVSTSAPTSTNVPRASGEVPTARPATASTSLPGEAPHEASRATSGRAFAIGFFSYLYDAEYAVIDFRSVGFPLNQITVIAQDFRRQDQFSGVNLGDRLEATDWEISVERGRFCQERLGGGEYMVIVQGTADELNCAESMLNRRGIQEWQIFNFHCQD